MGKTKDLGHLAHIVAYDSGNHITVPAGITMHTNQLVASQSYVTTALSSYALSSALSSYVPTSRTITINGTTLDLSANRTFTIAAGLSSFNTRTGDVTLTSSDVTTALGFTPVTNARTITINGTAYDLSANREWNITSMIYPAAGIALSTGSAWGTSITNNSANWNTAYGWGNHASAGYLTGITSTQVTTALGFTPYNATNPAGYITSAGSITGNAATVTNGVYTNASQNNLSGILNFGSSGATPYNSPTGTSNGIAFGGIESSSLRTYGIFTEQENIGGNYSKLTINYHTGIRIGAMTSYGGIRFYNNFAGGSGGGSEIFSIGNGDNNIRAVGTIIAPTFSGALSGTASGNVLSRGQSDWSGSGVINNVVGMLSWKNYGNSHVIFDASNGTSPSGGGVNQTNATTPWTATYPTLMGWNGSGTYGVRVDSARVADSAPANGGNSSTVGGYSVSVAGSANTIPTRNASGYLIPENWIQLNGIYGLYSPTNGAHLYVNNASYGSWRIEGTRNGWHGIHFGGANGMTLMMNEGEFGFHREGVGWTARFTSGTGYFNISGQAASISGQANSATINATSGNAGNNIVLRDGNGDIAIGTLNTNHAYFGGGGRGLTSADTYGSYGNVHTYGTGQNGYYGYGARDASGYRSFFMWEAGNGGIYMQDRGKWEIYYFGGNDCTGITGSETYDWVRACTNGKHRITNDSWCDATSWAYTFSNISDGRLKENIITVDSALDKVLQLRGVYYNWIIDTENKKHIGLIAQETAAVCPEVVNYHDETDTYSVNYSELSGLFVESTKELNQKLIDANARIELLETKINQLLNA